MNSGSEVHHRPGVDVAQHIAQHGLHGIDRPAVERQHAQAQSALAGRLSVPQGLEQPAIKPGQHEPHDQGQRQPQAARADDARKNRPEHHADHHRRANQHVDQVGRQPAKRPGQHVVKGDVFRRDDLNA